MRFLLILMCVFSLSAFGQRNIRDSVVSHIIVGANYKFNMTAGHMYERWGFNSAIGLDIDYKFKNNVTIGVDGSFIFGNRLKDSTIFDGVYNSFGTITSMSTGEPASVLFVLRGTNANVKAGYVFNQLGHNPNSGLWVTAGAGFLLHHIHIESIYDIVPQLDGDYKKGYDKLSVGFSTSQFIGYLFQANRRFTNFYAGIELVEGFTKNIRTYNFDTGGPESGLRYDVLYSFKFGWMIPIYKRTPRAYYYD